MAGLHRNGWPESPQNQWPEWTGKRNEQLKVLKNYRWSSLGGYLDQKRTDPRVIYDDVLGGVGGSRKKYGEFLEEGLKAGYPTPWEDLRGQVILGREGFVERLKRQWKGKTSRREQPSARIFEALDPEAILRVVSRYFEVGAEQIAKKRSGCRDQRGAAMELMYRYGRLSQADIGKRLGGLDYSAVSRERKRLRDKLTADRKLKRAMEELEDKLMPKVKI